MTRRPQTQEEASIGDAPRDGDDVERALDLLKDFSRTAGARARCGGSLVFQAFEKGKFRR